LAAGDHEPEKNGKNLCGKLQQMAQTLLQKEKIDEEQILAILGPRGQQEATK